MIYVEKNVLYFKIIILIFFLISKNLDKMERYIYLHVI